MEFAAVNSLAVPVSKTSTIPSDVDELESLSSATEDVLAFLNNEAKDHASLPGRIAPRTRLILLFSSCLMQLISQLSQLAKVLRITGDSLISYAKVIDSYEDVSAIPKEALWTPPTFSTSQDLAPHLLQFPPTLQHTSLFYPLTNVNLLQIARIQQQAQDNLAKTILTKNASRPIKKAPLRKMKSSSSDIAVANARSSALKNEVLPEDDKEVKMKEEMTDDDKEMDEIWDDLELSMEDLDRIGEAMAAPSASPSLSSTHNISFNLKKTVKKEEAKSNKKEPKDEEMQESTSAPVSTHVDLKKFLCPTSIDKTQTKAQKVNKQNSNNPRPSSSSSSGYCNPVNTSSDEQFV